MRRAVRGKSSDQGFRAENASRSYVQISIVLFVAILGVAILNFHIADKQKKMLQITQVVEQQTMLLEAVHKNIKLHQKNSDHSLAEVIRTDASAAQELEPAVLPLMMSATWGATKNLDIAPFKALGSLSFKGISYAAYVASNQSGYAYNFAREVEKIVQAGTIEKWQAEVRTFIAVVQKETDMLVQGSFALYGVIFLLLLYQSMSLVLPALKEITRQRDQLRSLAANDALTGLYNRAMLFKLAVMLISAAKRHKQELTALVVDVDAFEQLNMKYGRAVGDRALQLLSDELTNVLRTSDVIGRIGGDEFAIFLPATDEYRATYVAEKLRTAAEALVIESGEEHVLLTVSIGIAEIQAGHDTPDDMLRAVHTAVVRAKESGRNCCVTFSNMEAVVIDAAVAQAAH